MGKITKIFVDNGFKMVGVVNSHGAEEVIQRIKPMLDLIESKNKKMEIFINQLITIRIANSETFQEAYRLPEKYCGHPMIFYKLFKICIEEDEEQISFNRIESMDINWIAKRIKYSNEEINPERYPEYKMKLLFNEEAANKELAKYFYLLAEEMKQEGCEKAKKLFYQKMQEGCENFKNGDVEK